MNRPVRPSAGWPAARAWLGGLLGGLGLLLWPGAARALNASAAPNVTNATNAADATNARLLTCAVMAYQAGSNDLAIAGFTRLIEAGDREAYYGRAQARFRGRDYAGARSDLDLALPVEPSAAMLALRGRCRLELAEYPAAAADFSLALHLQPGQADWHLWRAEAWFYAGKISAALADYDRAIQLNPRAALAHAHRGELEAACRHEYARGIEDCLAAIRLDDHCWLAYNNLAAVLATCPAARFRDGPLAVLDARKACDLTQWNDPLPLSVLAAAYAENHDFASAIQWQQRSIQLDLGLGPEGDRLALAGGKKLAGYEHQQPFRTAR